MVEHLTHPVTEPSGALAEMRACARATQQAAAWIATRPGADHDLRFSAAAGHGGEAADELHRAHPDIYEHADIPTLAAQLHGLPTSTATDRLLAAIATCIGDLDSTTHRCRPATNSPQPSSQRPGWRWPITRSAAGCRHRGRRRHPTDRTALLGPCAAGSRAWRARAEVTPSARQRFDNRPGQHPRLPQMLSLLYRVPEDGRSCSPHRRRREERMKAKCSTAGPSPASAGAPSLPGSAEAGSRRAPCTRCAAGIAPCAAEDRPSEEEVNPISDTGTAVGGPGGQRQRSDAAARSRSEMHPPLPAVLDLPDAAKLLGLGRTTAYRLVRDEQWPTPVLRLGRLIKIPTQPLLDLLAGVATQHRVVDSDAGTESLSALRVLLRP
jgi:predicted DNA-binding transcriptional regulator AlpA